MDTKNRKAARLREFDYSSNGAYFVTVCVKDMKCILSTICENETNQVGAGVETRPYKKSSDE